MRIVFFGDSITDCDRDRSDRLSLGNGYVKILADKLRPIYPDMDIDLINSGVSGNEVCDLLARVQRDVIDHAPDAVVIMIGINNVIHKFKYGKELNLKQFEALKAGDALYRYIDEHYREDVTNYLFIDEVQLCDGFETVINSLYEEERFDIYLTGSNAFLLSSDLATLFGGRVFEIAMFPFSFREYLLYYPENDIQAAFDRYVIEGGMSGSYLYKDQTDARKYLAGIVRTTITKDIVTKFKIENEDLLNMIADFLMDNIGSKTSIRKIANTLTSNTYKTNDKTCGAYVEYLCRSFLFYPFKRYDVKGKRYLESDKKYYLADLSLARRKSISSLSKRA